MLIEDMVMINLTQINQTIVILINLLGIGVSLLVYLVNPKKKVHQFFSLWVIFSLLTLNFGYFASINDLHEYSLIFLRLRFGSVALFMSAVYFFTIYFPKKGEVNLFLGKAYILIWTILFCLSVFSPWIINRMESTELGIDAVFGRGAIIFFLWSVFSIFFILYILFRKYTHLSLKDRLKIQYFLVGALLYGSFNFVFNIIFPIIKNSMRYHEFGDYSIIFPFFFATYSIVKQELFGIKILLTEFLIGVMAVILLVLPFVIETTVLMRILLMMVFLSFSFIGRILIEYQNERTKMAQNLKEQVKSRTSELEQIRDVLEIKVRTRTKELEELNYSLEEKVTEKTRELQQRVNELEKFHKLSVDRELKMIELKKKIKELEQKS